MDFDLSTEQQLLKDSVDRFVQAEYDFAKRQRVVGTEEGFSRANWRTFADLGWLGVAIPEAYGGLGGAGVEVMVLMEAFGRGLVAEPFLSTVVLGAGLIRELGSEAQKAELLPRIASGELLVAVGFAEPGSRFDLAAVACTATPADSGWRLDGTKSVVVHGPSADRFLVTARTAGGVGERDGIGVFLVPPNAAGLQRVDARSFNDVPVSDLTLHDVTVGADALLGPPGGAFDALQLVVDEATAALCADAVGAMAAVHEATNEYLKTRRQFGQPIGRFQVLQHRMVDMFIELEQSRSLMYLATLKLGADAGERRRAVACAKSQTGEAGKFVGGQAVQLHGGMGMTDELSVSHYYKRLMMADILFGNAEHHLQEFARLTQEVGAGGSHVVER